MLPQGADQTISVPFGISFMDDEFKPWTEGTNRYRFYVNPAIVSAEPDEVKIGRMTEIYLTADISAPFFEPVPTGK